MRMTAAVVVDVVVLAVGAIRRTARSMVATVIALAGLAMRRSKQSTAVVLAAVIVLAGVASWLTVREPRGKVVPPPFEELGRVVAQHTAKVLNGSGKVVVWRLQFGDNEIPMIVAAAKAFDKTLRQTPGVVVVARVADRYDLKLGDDPLRQTAMASANFRQFLEKYPEADALVLLGAAPQLTARDCDQLPAARPKIVAAAILDQPNHELLEMQVVQVLIEARMGGFNGPPPKTPADRFAKCFVVLTAPTTGDGMSVTGGTLPKR